MSIGRLACSLSLLTLCDALGHLFALLTAFYAALLRGDLRESISRVHSRHREQARRIVGRLLRRGIQEGVKLPLALARRRLPPSPSPGAVGRGSTAAG